MAIVDACLRDGHGGSPTAVLLDAPMTDAERRRVPQLMGSSHAVFVSPHEMTGAAAHALRFFTAEEELPACGHGTIAALAFLAHHAASGDYRTTLRTPGHVLSGRAVRTDGWVTASFDAGPVELREPTRAERDLVLAAVGITADVLAPGIRVAAVGRPRLLVPVTTRSALAALTPDLNRLHAACDRLGLLGCYVYSAPGPSGRVAARMFAPSIGVPEDIANANSTACLAVHLADRGCTEIAVDMGDSLGSRATITAAAVQGPSGRGAHLAGAARISRVLPLPGAFQQLGT
ncbi:hypothetical protein Athai_38900 [Actinocatenispora thailandica]|uniref:Epimerase n=1 Tax=Actinocatenispora thailandica TaxID=227318 RepID=A0A7R7DRD6_9ACTN|nr:PhzF family phenazine biosynthesis isomerase [Actinocatenispora thailandica]BCJ36387.1 hypothetical protein Athai_38900 [Actinocatenispora thailandica]